MIFEKLLKEFMDGNGRLTVLTGAGISAESGIPTFRGPEGYWSIGSREYRPEEMATHAMFSQDPWEVWAWYLYRRAVCASAAPNHGHRAIVEMEALLGDRFRLVTQNVDGLHLNAGNSPSRTFQIHGNLNFMRCAKGCCNTLFPFPDQVEYKKKNQEVTPVEKELLRCPQCRSLARPHVLWFDEYYDETLFQAETAFQWATTTDLLVVVGTAGATTLPMQIGHVIFKNPRAILVDINITDNPFRTLARNHPRGVVLDGPAGDHLNKMVSIWKTIKKESKSI